MKTRWLLVVVAIGVAACGDGAATTTVATTVPQVGAEDAIGAVQGWLDAVTDGDIAGVDRYVSGRQQLLMLALENGLSYQDIAGLDEAGIDEAAKREYWQSFTTEFQAFTGVPPGDLALQSSSDLEVAGRRFSAVTASIPGGGSTEILAAEEQGAWTVDLMATFGPDLVRPLRDLLASLAPGEDGDTVRAMLAGIVPSLRAALLRPGAADLPVEYVLETESLIQLLVPRP